MPIWTATVDRSETPAVKWTSILPGKNSQPQRSDSLAEVLLIASGVTENWSWSVKATEDIEVSTRQLFAWLQELEETQSSSIGPLDPISDWEGAFQRLYVLSELVLNAQPPSIDLTIFLVPRDVNFIHEATRPLDEPTALELAVPFYLSEENSTSSNIERFSDLTRLLAATGIQMQHLALEAGITSAPHESMGRRVKSSANSACWITAVRRTIPAGTQLRVRPAPTSQAAVIPIFKSMYDQHPNDPATMQLLTSALFLRDADRFMRHAGLSWPVFGTDLESMDALLNFCQRYLRYSGDVIESPMPIDDFQPEAYLNISSP